MRESVLTLGAIMGREDSRDRPIAMLERNEVRKRLSQVTMYCAVAE
jgi:hypothetical protein